MNLKQTLNKISNDKPQLTDEDMLPFVNSVLKERAKMGYKYAKTSYELTFNEIKYLTSNGLKVDNFMDKTFNCIYVISWE